ncbi:hypothetical protein ACIHFD_33245 [Nonomuraea sp. NPDC051941]|uniref:hypothetical protein n=1 Tax=Nonomuraea sp. NPDC051941 TaxID=3364373 RepID=UPI0037CC5E4E
MPIFVPARGIPLTPQSGRVHYVPDVATAMRELRHGQPSVSRPDDFFADARMRRHRADHDRDLMTIGGIIPEIWDSTRLDDLACRAHISIRPGRPGRAKGAQRHDHHR